MITTFILTIVIYYSAGTGVLTSITQEYGSFAACENAKHVLRESLQKGVIILQTCTPKDLVMK